MIDNRSFPESRFDRGERVRIMVARIKSVQEKHHRAQPVWRLPRSTRQGYAHRLGVRLPEPQLY